ncbi:MAG: hypothetical protein ACK4ND_16425 [Cytophagaceae bacterium]
MKTQAPISDYFEFVAKMKNERSSDKQPQIHNTSSKEMPKQSEKIRKA